MALTNAATAAAYSGRQLLARDFDDVDLDFGEIGREVIDVRVRQRLSDQPHCVILPRAGFERLELCNKVRLSLTCDVRCVPEPLIVRRVRDRPGTLAPLYARSLCRPQRKRYLRPRQKSPTSPTRRPIVPLSDAQEALSISHEFGQKHDGPA